MTPRRPLSEREQAVLRLLLEGMSNPEIAQALALSEQSVREHMASLLWKYGLPKRRHTLVARLLAARPKEFCATCERRAEVIAAEADRPRKWTQPLSAERPPEPQFSPAPEDRAIWEEIMSHERRAAELRETLQSRIAADYLRKNRVLRSMVVAAAVLLIAAFPLRGQTPATPTPPPVYSWPAALAQAACLQPVTYGMPAATSSCINAADGITVLLGYDAAGNIAKIVVGAPAVTTPTPAPDLITAAVQSLAAQAGVTLTATQAQQIAALLGAGAGAWAQHTAWVGQQSAAVAKLQAQLAADEKLIYTLQCQFQAAGIK